MERLRGVMIAPSETIVVNYLDILYPYPILRQTVERAGGVLRLLKCQTTDEAAQACKDARAVIIHAFPMDSGLLSGLHRLQLIVNYSIGYDTTDVEAATEMGVIVCNTPTYCTEEVADHTMSLLLALARRLFPLTTAVRTGNWRNVQSKLDDRRFIRRTRGQTLGVIGYGKIGRAVAQRAVSFGLRILANDPYVDFDQIGGTPVVPCSLPNLLAESDFVSLHVPLTAETRGLIGVAELQLMKPSAILLNLSRGAVVNENALIHALREGVIRRAALDVLSEEPPPPDHPLLHMEDVIVTPHYGAASVEAIQQQQREASESVEAVLRGRWPSHVVNPGVIPRVSLQGSPPAAGGLPRI